MKRSNLHDPKKTVNQVPRLNKSTHLQTNTYIANSLSFLSTWIWKFLTVSKHSPIIYNWYTLWDRKILTSIEMFFRQFSPLVKTSSSMSVAFIWVCLSYHTNTFLAHLIRRLKWAFLNPIDRCPSWSSLSPL